MNCLSPPPCTSATLLAYLGVVAAIVGGGVALFNAWKAVRWKRAELASTYLKELNANPELIFACRALDWNGGRLVVPDSLRPLFPAGKTVIDHSSGTLRHAMDPNLSLSQMVADPRLQLYRTTMDSFLSWLSLVANALNRNLFVAADIEDVGYWVRQIEQAGYMEPFIDAFGYRASIRQLRAAFETR